MCPGYEAVAVFICQSKMNPSNTHSLCTAVCLVLEYVEVAAVILFSSAGCYPYYDRDPFILDKCPHIYFSGNQPSFQHKKIQGKL